MDVVVFRVGFVFLLSILLRWGTSHNPYSGQGTAPMFGDYEAQRHWMEITWNLPLQEWYVNSTRNDLLYWGLDYPPLTAYHSWICGGIASLINAEWVELYESRGFESYSHKLFMRYTVVVVDVMLFMPAVLWLSTIILPSAFQQKQVLVAVLILTYPGLILIDHGHFQYNCVSLGLALLAVGCLLTDRHVAGSVCFVLALNYKQMELYHAFPFFFYLLGMSLRERTWLRSALKLGSISIAVLVTFAVCWMPFLKSPASLLAVLERLFPFNRGVFEDKVANIWCAISIFRKIRQIFPADALVKLCTVCTLVACFPSSMNLLIRPTKSSFVLSLVNCSLAFFLFSYQVHEKSILLVALPVCLQLPRRPLESVWFLIISTFSMYPLLERDGQAVSYFALVILFYVMATAILDMSSCDHFVRVAFYASMMGAFVIHILAAFVSPPKRFPDLYPLAFSIYACVHFMVYLIWSNVQQLRSGTELAVDFQTSIDLKEKAT